MQFSAIKLALFFKELLDFHSLQKVFYRVTHVLVDRRRRKKFPIIPIVKLAKILKLSDNETHIKRQSVFQLETLSIHALGLTWIW